MLDLRTYFCRGDVTDSYVKIWLEKIRGQGGPAVKIKSGVGEKVVRKPSP